ncbi:J domain-containing protein [Lysobacter sp. KIS68-7]|uniref:J domain-containing protein n=1 Tax=Lysobacter sp. KIS68-7 TaxID=2904252 RepID=UPI001E3C8655|nr:J domain-containing protein [Lysobacter sp. KIS68-7]UHQ19039.1 J domain-containing protein [Lysobacter sp. KIS68-7]
MTFTEGGAIVSGLVVGYWLISVFLPNVRDESDASSDDVDPPTPAPPAWHDVLNVAPHASRAEIDLAYRRAIAQYHPDRVANLGPEIRAVAEAKSRQINEAYDQAMRSTVEL